MQEDGSSPTANPASALEALQEKFSGLEQSLRDLRRSGASSEALSHAAKELHSLVPQMRALKATVIGSERRRRVRNGGGRASAFRRFLLETFGQELLSSGGGMLDVAGGQGGLAIELLNLHAIPVTVVDPRPGLEDGHGRVFRRFERHWAHKMRNDDGDDGDDGEAEVGPRRPNHWVTFWRDALWRPLASDLELARWDHLQAAPSAAAIAAIGQALRERPRPKPSSRRTRKTAAAASNNFDAQRAAVPEEEEVAVRGGENVVAHDEHGVSRLAVAAWEMLRDCSAVVGMHPDGATESIVDFALATGKPFAVVPCCVFPQSFQGRSDPETGGSVTTHSQFVRYLRAKDPARIGMATLPFSGKNVVLYSTGGGDDSRLHDQGLCVACDPL